MTSELLERLRQGRDQLAVMAQLSELQAGLTRPEVAAPPRGSAPTFPGSVASRRALEGAGLSKREEGLLAAVRAWNSRRLERRRRRREGRVTLDGSALSFPGPVDLIVALCELNDRHGTGVLVQRIFRGEPGIVTVRSMDLYGGEQTFGARQVRITHDGADRREVFARVLERLGALDVRRILSVPFKPDDVQTALAAKAVFGAPLCTWVMDDQNIASEGIPDAPLRELFLRSSVRFAISPEMRSAYEAKYRLSFHLVPPVAEAEFVLERPGAPDPARMEERRGMLFGNIWGERWVEELLGAVRGSGVRLDWHFPSGTPWMSIDRERLGEAGVRVLPFLPEPELVEALRGSPFVVVPSGTLEGEDSHLSVARLSLPSRIPYIAATAGAPILVLGHPETAAAHFVTRHGVGVVVRYDRRALARAVDELCTPEAQARYRARAAALAPSLSSSGVRDWLWRSMDAGRPVDERWKELV